MSTGLDWADFLFVEAANRERRQVVVLTRLYKRAVNRNRKAGRYGADDEEDALNFSLVRAEASLAISQKHIAEDCAPWFEVPQ